MPTHRESTARQSHRHGAKGAFGEAADLAGLAAGVHEFGSDGTGGGSFTRSLAVRRMWQENHAGRIPNSRPPDDALGAEASDRSRSSVPRSRALSAHGRVSRRIAQKSGQLLVVAVGLLVSDRHCSAAPASRHGDATGNGTWYSDRSYEVLVWLPL